MIEPDARPVSRLTWPAFVAVAALIALFLAQSTVFIFKKNFTWDETRYLAVGRYLVSHRPWSLDNAVQHPPLAYYLSALGLVGIEMPAEVWTNDNAVERGNAIVLANGDEIVARARLPMLVLGPILGFTLFAWSRRLFGTRGAFLSLGLFALSPNLIANQSLITPDFALTTFIFLTGWCFYEMIRTERPVWVVLTGVSAGLALLSKFTALFLLPVTALWVAGYLHTRGTTGFRRLAIWVAVAGVVAGLVVLAGYRFQVRPLLRGILFQFNVSRDPWAGYLLGEISKEGWPHYFLIASLVKLPVPVLVLTALSVLPFFRTRRPDALACWVLLAPIVFFFVYLSLFNRLNIGFRYLLPAVPFLFVWLGQMASLETPVRKKTVLFSVLLAWQAASVGRVFPHYLAYFNEIAGGPENGHRWLGDANLDWGQDLKGLKRYIDNHQLKRVCVSYFGTMPMELYGLRSCEMSEAQAAAASGSYLALSVTKLQGIYLDDPNQYRWLRGREPIPASWLGILRPYGYSIRVYRF